MLNLFLRKTAWLAGSKNDDCFGDDFKWEVGTYTPVISVTYDRFTSMISERKGKNIREIVLSSTIFFLNQLMIIII